MESKYYSGNRKSLRNKQTNHKGKPPTQLNWVLVLTDSKNFNQYYLQIHSKIMTFGGYYLLLIDSTLFHFPNFTFQTYLLIFLTTATSGATQKITGKSIQMQTSMIKLHTSNRISSENSLNSGYLHQFSYKH